MSNEEYLQRTEESTNTDNYLQTFLHKYFLHQCLQTNQMLLLNYLGMNAEVNEESAIV